MPAAGPAASGENASWMVEVSARVRDAAHRFVPDGSAFVAQVPERGMSGRFDTEGAGISLGDDTVSVRFVGLGRDTHEATGPVPPRLGACIDGMNEPSGACVRRLEYGGPGWTGWWASREEGFEQGWTVEFSPEGDGYLSLEVALEGASVTVSRDELWLQGEAGGLVMVTGLQAWDADGEPLETWFEVAEQGFRVRVLDAGATYPIEIDPVYTTAAWSVVGTEETGALGGSVSGAGDVNGDGYDDVIVGAYSYASYTGRAYVFFGSSAGISTTAAGTLTGAAGSYFGYAVSGAGDVNNDGYDDVVVGGYADSSETGRVEVFQGSSSGVSTTAATTLTGEAMADQFGFSVSGAGDVNGDGYDDVMVGAVGYGSYGRVYVYPGSAGGVATAASTLLTGVSASPSLGYVVSAAGDVNDDGYGDVLVTARDFRATINDVYVYHGSSGGVLTTATTTLVGISGDLFGASVACAGDVNNDGYDDILVGSAWYDADTGRAYVYQGSSAGVSTTAATTLTGEAGPGYFGSSVAGAGDVNDDGYDDVIVGAPGYAGSSGRAYVYPGSSGGVATTAASLLTGDTSTAFATSVSGAGDVDNDGYDDVIVGAPSGSYGVSRAAVYHGAAVGLSTTATTALEGTQGSYLGSAVSDAGDVNGDGYGDVIVGTSISAPDAGRAYVYTGSSSGLSVAASTTLAGAADSRYFGYSVSGSGDVNGDGYDDVVVGSAGQAYIFHGSSSGVSSTVATLTEPFVDDDHMRNVSGAGDVNGDGYDDVIVGATSGRYETWPARALIYQGSASGVPTTESTTIPSGGLLFGASVSGAGDVNGDGYDDVIIGDPPSYSGSGVAEVFLGSSSGVATTAATRLWVGVTDHDYFGASVSGAGDVDNDGYDDVIVGAYAESGGDGRAYVYHGSGSGVSTTATSTFDGGASEALGSSVSGAGDVNGDGYDDVIVGSSGGAYVFSGTASGVSTTATTTLGGTGEASGAGDVNGDGYDDVIVGTGYGVGAGRANVYHGYADDDGDGVAATDDCDDTDASVGAPSSRYVDTDGDGYGTSSTAAVCPDLAGYADVGGDCDDGDAAISPADPEVCDAANTDEDCDGLADNGDASATGASTFYADTDGDGYGGDTIGTYCDLPAGYAANSTDCDDGSAAISPGATEVCDAANTDEDCDGLADNADASATGKSTFYTDDDGDGYGGDTIGTYCDLPAGYAANSTDCDDATASVNPGATEVCDAANTDEDCDGLADNADASATGASTFYADTDGDGYGGDTIGTYCDLPSGYAVNSTDCDDTDTAYHPGALEVDCTDPHDYNCDGSAGFANADGDAFAACEDCDDADATINPAATELIGDEVDQDCDGLELCYEDRDRDGYRIDSAAGTATVESADLDCQDPGELADESPTGDCDDDDVLFHPGAAEADCADPNDYNCDGSTGFANADGDAFAACEDCDDADATTFPGADELPDDGVDQDCDGADTTTGVGGVDTAVDTGEGTEGCGCSSNAAAAGWLGLLGVLTLAMRRGSPAIGTPPR